MVVPMLRPMLAQYLVGLCCLRHDPEAVDVIVGDFVFDDAGRKERDVDITVTVKDKDGINWAFKAYEVKRESSPLGIEPVEQLILKLRDMKSVTHRAIVSASGFTSGARDKAQAHGVSLYELAPWSGRVEDDFPGWEMSGPVDQIFRFGQTLLVWHNHSMHVVIDKGPKDFILYDGEPLFTKTGKPHRRYATFGAFKQELVLRSTELLLPFAPDPTPLLESSRPEVGQIIYGDDWPHAHTIETGVDQVYVELNGVGLVNLVRVTISGRMRWEHTGERPEYYVMRSVPDGEVFAGALVGLGKRPGQMCCFVLSPDPPEAHIHLVQLTEKQLNMIRRLQIEIPVAPHR